MGKPRMLGMNKAYIPNAQADMRHRRKLYQRCREIVERPESKKSNHKHNEERTESNE